MVAAVARAGLLVLARLAEAALVCLVLAATRLITLAQTERLALLALMVAQLAALLPTERHNPILAAAVARVARQHSCEMAAHQFLARQAEALGEIKVGRLRMLQVALADKTARIF